MKTETYIENGIIINKVTPSEEDLASENLKKERRDVCSKCEYYQKDNTCSFCGCITDSLMTYVYSKCPTLKW